MPVDLSGATSDRFGKFRAWNAVLSENGPFDEPSFCFGEGVISITQSGLIRQAVAAFTRVRELAPDNLPARLLLAQIYLISHMPDRTLEVLHDPLEQPEEFSLARTNSTQLNILAAAAYLQKNDLAHGTQLLENEIARHPDQR